MCNVMYLYIQYKYIYIYIRVFVCVWGLPQNEVSFVPLKEPFLEPKKDRYIHVYTIYIYIYIHRCFFKSCVGLSHPKYMFSGFLLYVVFQHHFIGKNVSNQKVVHWRLQYK